MAGVAQHEVHARVVAATSGGHPRRQPEHPARNLPPEITEKARPRPGDGTLDLHDQERASIEHALERFGGNRRNAAAALGIGTVTPWSKMRQYGLAS
jgi:transcriptional regulator of acetoin/glycerol metabolism